MTTTSGAINCKRQSLVDAITQKAQHLFGPLFAKEAKSHAKRHAKALDMLENAAIAGDWRKVREIQTGILRSYSARLVCLIRSLKKYDGFTPEDARKTAAALRPWQDPWEGVDVFVVPKSWGKGGWRPISVFGPKRKALQTLGADILRARFGTDPVDYLTKGRGADRATDHILELVKEGYQNFVLADIKDFFGSVQQEALAELIGLPKAVIRSCMLIGANVCVRKHVSPDIVVHPNVVDRAVRRGLPQGSRTSNLIAGVLLGPALREITSADRIVVHGDDVAIAARDEKEGKALKTALSEMLASHPAGPFCLKICEVRHIYEGFDYLKYRHRCDWFSGEMRVRPAGKSYARFRDRVTMLTMKHPWPAALRRIARYRGNWMRAFSRWKWNWFSKVLLVMTTRQAVERGQMLKNQAAKEPSAQ